jgi:predicted DNA-binding transcriptional regulator AlpA
MGTITIQFSDENDQQLFVELLAKAITQAIAEPLAQAVSTLGSGVTPPVTDTSKPDEPQSELVDVNAVAALIGASARTVRRLADWGRMPRPISLGRMVRWQRSVIEEWIREGCPRVERRGIGRRRGTSPAI